MVRHVGFGLSMLISTLASAGPGVTIVAPAAPGGGWDQTARVMQRVLLQIEPGSSVQVENVPGAAGTIGLARFLQSERGNPNALLVTGLVMVSGVVMNRSPVTLADAIPVARLTGEFEVIVVPASSPFRSLADLLAAFTRDPAGTAWGGGSAGGTDDLLVRLIAEQIGLAASRVNYVAFSGGGAALSAVLGGQLAAGVSGYSEFAGQIESGQLRVLAVSAAERVGGIDAPTLREAGVALDLANWRAVVAPPGLSEVERMALIERVTAMARSSPWKAALEQNGWSDLFLPGQEFKQFLLAEQGRVEAVLRRLATTDHAPTAGLALGLTPTTVPTVMVTLLLGSLVAFAVVHRPGVEVPHKRDAMAVTLTLLAMAVLLPRLGFVPSATLLFVVVARSLDPSADRSGRRLALHVGIGFLFAAALFVVFGRGLGVMLPATPGLRGSL